MKISLLELSLCLICVPLLRFPVECRSSAPTIQLVWQNDRDSFEDIIYRIPANYRCAKNEVFYDCLPSCPITCASLSSSSCRYPRKISSCKRGCDCARGFARLYRGGECVRVVKCPGLEDDRFCADPKEEFQKCGNSCHESCYSGTSCPTTCRPGCFCKRGYKRMGFHCVDQRKCPVMKPTRICSGQHEIFVKSHSCHEKCEKPFNCGFDQVEERCFCRTGFKRINGVCVDDANCPRPTTPSTPSSTPSTTKAITQRTTLRPCPLNEELRIQAKCREECILTDFCDNQSPPSQPICVCREGFKRVDGKCVPGSNCRCPLNASFHGNSNTCLHNRQCNPDPNTTCGTVFAGQYCWCNEGHGMQDNQCLRCSEIPDPLDV